MADRVTNGNIQYKLDAINRIFNRYEKNVEWRLSGRNGYTAIDSGPADGYASDMVCSGTKREVYEALCTSFRALEVLGKKPIPSAEEREREAIERQEAIDRFNEKWDRNRKEQEVRGEQ